MESYQNIFHHIIFLIFENVSKKDVKKLKNELLYINARFILDDNKRNVLLNSDDIKKI